MPTPLTPTSSGEIVCISPPPRRSPRSLATKRKRIDSPPPHRKPLLNKTNSASRSSNLVGQESSFARQASPSYTNKGKARAIAPSINRPTDGEHEVIVLDDDEEDVKGIIKEEEVGLDKYNPSTATTLPRPRTWSPTIELKDQAYRARNAYDAKDAMQTGKRKIRKEDVKKAGEDMASMPREAVTAKMLSTLGKDSNPITNSDLYTRTDHFVSVATGHQVSNRGGGSSGAQTYWQVRTAKMEEQAREKKSDLLKGLVFYINGTTGPRVSNLQLQHLITSHGGRFVPMQSSSCTHILAQNLSGSKTQKWIDGQAGRGGAKRTKIVRIDWLLDSVEKGIRLSEVPYSVIHNPSQHTILNAFAPN